YICIAVKIKLHLVYKYKIVQKYEKISYHSNNF
ncbi:MAG: hypothetical protein ACI8V7_000331, partial [Candidatus Paceibacteria bacterium]